MVQLLHGLVGAADQAANITMASSSILRGYTGRVSFALSTSWACMASPCFRGIVKVHALLSSASILERPLASFGREWRCDEVLIQCAFREVGVRLRWVGSCVGADAQRGVRDQARPHLLELVLSLLSPGLQELVRALRSRAAEDLGVILFEHLLGLVVAGLAHGGLVVVGRCITVGGM